MKRILNTTLLTVLLLSFTGCVPPTPSQGTEEKKIDSVFIQKALQPEPSATTQKHSDSFPTLDNIHARVHKWIDPDTGVEYLVIETAGTVRGFSVRYGSDGKVIVHKTDEQ